MILLAISIAVPNQHARLARLETDASSILAAIGTAGVDDLVHLVGEGQTEG
jgi:hypothetical protein